MPSPPKCLGNRHGAPRSSRGGRSQRTGEVDVHDRPLLTRMSPAERAGGRPIRRPGCGPGLTRAKLERTTSGRVICWPARFRARAKTTCWPAGKCVGGESLLLALARILAPRNGGTRSETRRLGAAGMPFAYSSFHGTLAVRLIPGLRDEWAAGFERFRGAWEPGSARNPPDWRYADSGSVRTDARA